MLDILSFEDSLAVKKMDFSIKVVDWSVFHHSLSPFSLIGPYGVCLAHRRGKCSSADFES